MADEVVFVCAYCKSVGFEQSTIGPDMCTFCDGTFSGSPIEPKTATPSTSPQPDPSDKPEPLYHPSDPIGGHSGHKPPDPDLPWKIAGETVERVLFNPNNAVFAVGIRIQFYDKSESENLGGKMGVYEITLRKNELDGWIIDNHDGVWIYVPQGLFEKDGIEDLGWL